MATLNQTNLTLADVVNRTDPGGAVSQIVESLTQRNSVMSAAVWKEGNLPTGHRFTSRTGLPSISWRKMNEGVTPSKSKTAQVDEAIGQMEGWSVVDCALARLNGNEAAFRASEDMSFLQAFENEAETGFFYHSTASAPEKFQGLSPRLNSTTGQAGKQILLHDASASGNDQTSIYLVVWGDNSVYFIYPKGSTGGIQPHDMGEQPWDDGTGKKFRAYVTNWSWQMGLVVQDYRQVCRAANVDTGNLAATGNAVIQTMIKMYHQVWNPNAGRAAFYVNRGLGTFLHLQALDSTKQSTLSIDQIGGKPITTLLGVPIYVSDAILNTESVIS
jgi:hypothetical protein